MIITIMLQHNPDYDHVYCERYDWHHDHDVGQ